MEKEELFRKRLSMETARNIRSVFGKPKISVVRKLQMACQSQEEYTAWKKQYLSKAMEEAGDKSFLTCEYMFIGMGHYEETLPEESLPSFQCWIDSNGSAFLGEVRPATGKEKERYFALHAADDLAHEDDRESEG